MDKPKSYHKKEETHPQASMLGEILKGLTINLDRNNDLMTQILERMRDTDSARKTHSIASFVESSKTNISRSDKVTVELKLTFMKIDDIDTVDQQFQAEIFVQAKWLEPNLTESSRTFDPTTMWVPRLFIINLDGILDKNKITYSIHHGNMRHPQVIMLWRFRGCFKENLELQHFPMDVQDLTISVSTERSSDEIELVEDQIQLSSVNTKTFMDAQEWSIYKHVETYRDQTTIEYASSTIHPILHVQCRVARKIGYFVWNIIFIVALIISLTFATFSIEPDSSDRLAVTITLFLTAVAFKLVVKQSLPTISYLTYLDLYVLAALIFLGLNATQNASLKHMAKTLTSADTQMYDYYSMGILAIIFVLYHIIFGIYIIITASKRRWAMTEKDRLYQEKKKYMDKYTLVSNR